MAKYICFKCRFALEIEDVNQPIVCPKCSGRIFFKEPAPIKRVVNAI
ncbi:MAG: DNA-directed RNA polymerase subunit P [Candidatus Nanohaloarchaeota archaeon]|nr:DNA-directed RNA polymerase subunit P [Candidatus Nanohaloarchaeota archaeon]